MPQGKLAHGSANEAFQKCEFDSKNQIRRFVAYPAKTVEQSRWLAIMAKPFGYPRQLAHLKLALIITTPTHQNSAKDRSEPKAGSGNVV